MVKRDLILVANQVVAVLYSVILLLMLSGIDSFDFKLWLFMSLLLQLPQVLNFGLSATFARYLAIVQHGTITSDFPLYLTNWEGLPELRGYILKELIYAVSISWLLYMCVGYWDASIAAVSFITFAIRFLNQYMLFNFVNIANALDKAPYLRRIELFGYIVRIVIILLLWKKLTVSTLFLVEGLVIFGIILSFHLKYIRFGSFRINFGLMRHEPIVLKLGLILLTSYLLNYGTGLVINFLDLAVVTNYLFTLRFVLLIRLFAGVIVTPLVARYNGIIANSLDSTVPFSILKISGAIGLSLASGLLLFYIITMRLEIPYVKFHWLDMHYFIILILGALLELHHGVVSQVLYARNIVPFYGLNFLIISLLTIFYGISYWLSSEFLFVVSIPLANILTVNWLLPRKFINIYSVTSTREYFAKIYRASYRISI